LTVQKKLGKSVAFTDLSNCCMSKYNRAYCRILLTARCLHVCKTPGYTVECLFQCFIILANFQRNQYFQCTNKKLTVNDVTYNDNHTSITIHQTSLITRITILLMGPTFMMRNPFNNIHIRTSDSPRSSLVVLLYLENMGRAVGILLLSCIEADNYTRYFTSTSGKWQPSLISHRCEHRSFL